MKQANIKFTYHDYLLLPDDKRYEILQGELYVVPAPNIYHQLRRRSRCLNGVKTVIARPRFIPSPLACRPRHGIAGCRFDTHQEQELIALMALSTAFGPNCHVRVQAPLALDDVSEPEPDLAIVEGSVRDFSAGHPSTALLVVEVSDTTIQKDRERKGSLYARAGIPEYWILNLIDRRLEVYRDPAGSGTARFGAEYKSIRFFTSGESVSPLHAPQSRIAVEDLLP